MPGDGKGDLRPRMAAAALGRRIGICDVVCGDSHVDMEIRTAGALAHMRFAKICYSVRDPYTMIFL
jgi:hypothetical protein